MVRCEHSQVLIHAILSTSGAGFDYGGILGDVATMGCNDAILQTFLHNAAEQSQQPQGNLEKKFLEVMAKKDQLERKKVGHRCLDQTSYAKQRVAATRLYLLQACLHHPAARRSGCSAESCLQLQGNLEKEFPVGKSVSVAEACERAVGFQGVTVLGLDRAGVSERNLNWVLPLICEPRVQSRQARPVRYVRAKASTAYDFVIGRLAANFWRTHHFDNYSHKYYIKAFSPSKSTYRPAAWTAWGFTLTDINIDSLPVVVGKPAFPANMDYTDGDLMELSLSRVKTLAANDSLLGGLWRDGIAAQAADFRHPLGAGGPHRQRVGTAYQPLELQPFDCQSNQGLIRVLCRVGIDLCAPQGPPLVRLDIGIWWRVMKSFASGRLGSLGNHLRDVVFFMAPWHSYKHLACKIWDSLCPGALVNISNNLGPANVRKRPSKGRLRTFAGSGP